MDREEVAKQAGVIPAKNLAAFLEYLVRTPELPGLLGKPHSADERLQGDLIKELPWALVNEAGEAKAVPFTVAVINNTCDLQPDRSQFINIVPVIDFRIHKAQIIKIKGEKNAEGHLSSLTRNKIDDILYVQECPEYPEGIVIYLDRIATISAKLYEQALAGNRRVASFTQNGFYIFLLKVTRFLARAETHEVTRTT